MKKEPTQKPSAWRLWGVKRTFAWVCLLAFCGSAAAQTGKTVSIRAEQESVRNVLEQLEKAASVSFMYDEQKVSRTQRVSLHFEEAPLGRVLGELCRQLNMDYDIRNGVVMLVEKSARPESQPRQSKTVKGEVLDMDGHPLPGVTVLLKGTGVGTTTNTEGRFSIQVPNPERTTLVFSFIGMETVEAKCDEDYLTIRMENYIEQLTEVIINTGYQQLDRRMSSSSVFSIQGSDVVESNALTLDNMLLGKVPGMTVLNSTSTPGAATKIRIRGSSTISGNREPLWVVDGVILEDPVPISTEELNSLDNVNLIGNAISSLNPADIERIDILKDASSTAIYGVRAANGVIVVTTKKGRKGKPSVNYSGTFTLTERPSYRKLHLMDSKERIDVSKEIEQRGIPYSFAPSRVGYEGALYDWYDRKITFAQFQEQVKRLEETNTDWFDIIYRTPFTHKHNLSISGGSDLVNYYFSLGYANDESNVKNSNVEQVNANMKLTFNFRKNLNATVQLRNAHIEKKYPHSSLAPYEYAYNTSRAIPAYNPDGTLSYYAKEVGFVLDPLLYNVINEMEESGKDIVSNTLNLTTQLEWRILPSLRATGTFAMGASHTSNAEWFSEFSYQAAKLRNYNSTTELPDNDVWKQDQCQLPYGGLLDNSEFRNLNYTLRGQLDYRHTFAVKHELTAVAGAEIRTNKDSGIQTKQYGYLPHRGKKFADISFTEWPQYAKLVQQNPNIVTDRLTNVASFFGILSYVYDSRYILNFNIRTDGSNKFGQDKSTRFLPIWSVSAKWNIQNEYALQDLEWMNELAIRGSYGLQGNVSNDQTPNLIVQLGALDATSGQYISKLSKLPNPYLKWEKTHSYNVALDFSFLQNRLSGTVEYYYKKGKDQIITKKVSKTTGMSSMSLNMGTIMNKGYELIVNAVPVRTKDFTWSLSLNGAKNINRVSKLDMSSDYGYNDYLNGTAIFPDKAVNSFYSYKFDKLDENGLPTFKDIEETEGITKEEMYAKVFKYSGNRVPDIQGGIGTTFTYKNWSLNLFFSYSLGSHIRLNNLYSDLGQQLPQPQQNMPDEFVNRWRKPGDEAWSVIPTLSNETLGMTGGLFDEPRDIEIANNKWQMYNKSDLRVVSGNYIRLRNVSLRYGVPSRFCQRARLKAANMRLEAANPVLFASKKLLGQDPEQLTLGGPTTPPVASFTLGIDVTF